MKSQKGAAMVEYTIVAMTMVAIMFTPIPRSLGGDGVRSAVEMLSDSFKENYSGYAWGMSVPL